MNMISMNFKKERRGGLVRLSFSQKKSGGFTLLELLIVISIIAILSVALIFVINPAETLKKSRDAQRISDLNTMKTALGLYTTSTATPLLAGTSNTACKTGAAGGNWAAGDLIYYSVAGIAGTNDLDGGTDNATSSVSALTDGTGWLPVNFDSLIGGSPISNLPLDPVNALASGDGATSMSTSTLAYRYACNATSLTYEIDAVLESDSYASGSDNKLTKDGGNNSNFFEVGTNLKILGTGAGF